MLKKKKMKAVTAAREEILTKISLENQPLKQVRHFKYLGSTISSSMKIHAEIENRCNNSNQGYWTNDIFTKKQIHHK